MESLQNFLRTYFRPDGPLWQRNSNPIPSPSTRPKKSEPQTVWASQVEPIINLAVPRQVRLAYGDMVVADIFGRSWAVDTWFSSLKGLKLHRFMERHHVSVSCCLVRVPGRTPSKPSPNPSTGMAKKINDQVLPIKTTVDSFQVAMPAKPRTAKPTIPAMKVTTVKTTANKTVKRTFF